MSNTPSPACFRTTRGPSEVHAWLKNHVCQMVGIPALTEPERVYLGGVTWRDLPRHSEVLLWKGNPRVAYREDPPRIEVGHATEVCIDAYFMKTIGDGHRKSVPIDRAIVFDVTPLGAGETKVECVCIPELQPFLHQLLGKIAEDWLETAEAIAAYRAETQCRTLAEPYFRDLLHSIESTWSTASGSADVSTPGGGDKSTAVFRHVFDNAGVAHLKDSLMDHWGKAWQRHTGFKIGQRSTFTEPPKASSPVNGVTTIMVPGWSEEPRSEAEKAQLLADPEWVQHMSEMDLDPTHATFTSSDFYNTTELRPMEFRIRDLGGTRAELVATYWDADLEHHFRRWLDELASLWPEAAPAIDRYLGREGGEGEAEARESEMPKRVVPWTPTRGAEFNRWCSVWQLIRRQAVEGKSIKDIAAWLKKTHPGVRPKSERKLGPLIAAGEYGLLDRPVETS